MVGRNTGIVRSFVNWARENNFFEYKSFSPPASGFILEHIEVVFKLWDPNRRILLFTHAWVHESLRRRGVFTSIVDTARTIYRPEIIQVQCANTGEMEQWCSSKGFSRIGESNDWFLDLRSPVPTPAPFKDGNLRSVLPLMDLVTHDGKTHTCWQDKPNLEKFIGDETKMNDHIRRWRNGYITASDRVVLLEFLSKHRLDAPKWLVSALKSGTALKIYSRDPSTPALRHVPPVYRRTTYTATLAVVILADKE